MKTEGFMRFVFPTSDYEQRAIDFIQEFYDHSSEINGSGGLDFYLKKHTYADWLKKVHQDIDIINVPKSRVPAMTYFYVDDSDHIVGMINLRLALNDFLRKESGHIGYCVRPTQRGHGHASGMLSGALDLYRTLNFSEVFLFCVVKNIASARIIEKCGGTLQDQFHSDFFDADVQKYRIEL